MPLPGSGQLHQNEIHVEAGGGSGAACTINDSDIRGLISKSASVPMNFAEWYGAEAWELDTTITPGSRFISYDTWHWWWGYNTIDTGTLWGYDAAGSTSDGSYYEDSLQKWGLHRSNLGFGTLTNKSFYGNTITALYDSYLFQSDNLMLSVAGDAVAWTAFDVLEIGGTTFNRSDSAHYQNHNGGTHWVWDNSQNIFTSTTPKSVKIK